MEPEAKYKPIAHRENQASVLIKLENTALTSLTQFYCNFRKSAAMSLSLSALLGLSWLSGYLLYVETDFFAYVFTITNGLQVTAGCEYLLDRADFFLKKKINFRD